MTLQSLSNFGTPGLSGERAASVQPILTNKFRVLTYNFGATAEPAPYDITRHCVGVTLPTVDHGVIPLYNYVSTVYIATRAEWGQGSLTFRDDILNTVRRRLENQSSKQQNFFDQTSSRAGENYKFEMDVDILAGGASAGGSANDPNILRKYVYSGCTLVSYNDGTLGTENSSVKDLTMDFRYDNVIIFDQDGNRMGTFSHAPEINARAGSISTGVGAAGGSGVTITGSITFG